MAFPDGRQGGNAEDGFFDTLAARAEEINSLLCVGLDPHQTQLGEDDTALGAKNFSLRLIEATSTVALAYKPNSAFFERFGVRWLALPAEQIKSDSVYMTG